MYFITTPDDTIETTCKELINQPNFNPKAALIHCSGALSSHILSSAKAKGCSIISVHPIKSFASPEFCVTHFSGTYCSYEGDQELKPLIEHLFGSLGAVLIPIDPNKKTLYHAASTMANNYLVMLHYAATSCYEKAGLSPDEAYTIVSNFMKETALRLKKSNNQKDTLTGPLKRADKLVLQNHVQELSQDPLLKAIYVDMALLGLNLTNHSPDLKESIKDLLKKA